MEIGLHIWSCMLGVLIGLLTAGSMAWVTDQSKKDRRASKMSAENIKSIDRRDMGGKGPLPRRRRERVVCHDCGQTLSVWPADGPWQTVEAPGPCRYCLTSPDMGYGQTQDKPAPPQEVK